MEAGAEIFAKQERWGHAAECYFKLGQLRKAASTYARARLFSNAFECYERLEDWDGLLQCLHRNKDCFPADEREALVDRYVPIALNQLYTLY